MTAALEGGEWSAARPGRTLPPGETRYPFYRRLGGLQSRSGRAVNLFLTGIRFRTVQPVVSRYTDWATRPTCICIYVYVYINEWFKRIFPPFLMWRLRKLKLLVVTVELPPSRRFLQNYTNVWYCPVVCFQLEVLSLMFNSSFLRD